MDLSKIKKSAVALGGCAGSNQLFIGLQGGSAV